MLVRYLCTLASASVGIPEHSGHEQTCTTQDWLIMNHSISHTMKCIKVKGRGEEWLGRSHSEGMNGWKARDLKPTSPRTRNTLWRFWPVSLPASPFSLFPASCWLTSHRVYDFLQSCGANVFCCFKEKEFKMVLLLLRMEIIKRACQRCGQNAF